MTFPVLSAGTSAYNLTNSLRFRSSATAYLNRTFTTGSATQWTWSSWVKRGSLGPQAFIFAPNNTAGEGMYFNSSNQFAIAINGSFFLVSTAVYRDPSAWYHVVVASDMGNATPALRCRVYINGVEITAWATDARASYSSWVSWNSGVNHNIGVSNANTIYWDGYLTEINFVGGQTLTPSSFGSTNAVTGVWQPAKYTGTYGTNGFYLPFTNTTSTSTLGNDFSGNGNNWTTNNISLTPGVTYDSMTDVPTLTSPTAANFATLNPLKVGATPGDVIANGNLRFFNTNSTWYNTRATIQPPISGKYYVEFTSTQNWSSNNVSFLGLSTPAMSLTAAAGDIANIYTTTTSGEVLALAIDRVNNQVSTYRNNSLVATTSISATNDIDIAVGSYAASGDINFGQRPFAYTPPSGFVALNTFNLPSSTIPAGNKFMDATLYTGTGSSLSVTNSGAMQPGLVWIKSRSAATDHALYDVLRGTQARLESNTTDAEVTSDNGVTAFGTGGFTVNTLAQVNTSAATYVGWQWKANGAGVTNTSGSITSTVSANTTSGFSVVTYTGTGSTATVGHGLGVAPSMLIVKRRNSTGDWGVYHASLSANGAVFLNLTDAYSTPGPWNNTAPTSSQFTIATGSFLNANGGTYVAYCFTPIAGFSAFGSYTGNGSTDGPFIYTGFRPRWIMCKSTTEVGSWTMIDTSRIGYNANNYTLYADLTNTDQGYLTADIVSNGFKIRVTGTGTSFNTSGQSYIYACFAENPFKNALAR